MATRSTIAIRNEDGTITGIYCHWDGYLDHNGQILLDHYNSEERARALIALGAVSVLAPSIECPEGHDFENRVDGYTSAYHRDRGEDFAQLKAASHSLFGKYFEEFNYLWANGQWHVTYYDQPLRTLEDAIALEAAGQGDED